jgi:hypothetical protein
MVDLHDVQEETPSPPPATTRTALEQQNTDQLRKAARRYAESRIQFVRAARCPIPKHYAQELVDDAIADTWLGVVHWDPDRCSLLVHVRSEIRRRTFNDARHGRRFPRVTFDIAANDPHDASLIELQLAPVGGSPIVFAALVSKIATALKVLACGDPNAVAILCCWQESLLEREDVLARTQMTLAEYKAARKRLLSLSKKLPPEARDSAREFLRSAS